MNKQCKVIFGMLMLGILALASCTKTDEPTHPIGQKVPYTGAPTRTLSQMLDSIPGVTFFDSAYKHAGMSAYLDSLRQGVNGAPFTLFVPTDDAFRAAGYTLQQIDQSPKAVLDSILFYLTAAGNYTYTNLDSFAGNGVIYTLLKDPNMKRSLSSPGFNAGNPYQYLLYTGLYNGTLWLNGTAVRTAAQSLQATDGVIWMVDKLVLKPSLETYQVLTQDTTYSYYMTALHISDSVYHSPLNFSLQYFFSDTVGLQLVNQQAYLTVLAPTNEAFRNAGFSSVDDIYTYIYGCRCIRNGGVDGQNRYIRTNMDSILDLHRVGYAPYSQFNNNYVTVVLHSNDMLYDPSSDNMLLWAAQPYDAPQTSDYTGVEFQNNDGQVVVHRVDAPSGRAVNVISPHDITTLNGVVHRVDNLLLPTP